jgi:hypothetical protein
MVFVVRTMLRQSVVKRLIVDGKACKGGCRAASDRDVMVLEGEESEDVASRAATDIGEVVQRRRIMTLLVAIELVPETFVHFLPDVFLVSTL